MAGGGGGIIAICLEPAPFSTSNAMIPCALPTDIWQFAICKLRGPMTKASMLESDSAKDP